MYEMSIAQCEMELSKRRQLKHTPKCVPKQKSFVYMIRQHLNGFAIQ